VIGIGLVVLIIIFIITVFIFNHKYKNLLNIVNSTSFAQNNLLADDDKNVLK